jgi:hypothetical protein
MDWTIARLDIEHFQKLLAKETDEAKRRTLLSLIAEEKAKLAAAEKAKLAGQRAAQRTKKTPLRRAKPTNASAKDGCRSVPWFPH